jgi:alkaline phosphatase D
VVDLERRTVLHGLGAAALAAGLRAVRPWEPAVPSRSTLPRPLPDPFTLGVASGDPWPTGVVLWTRLAPDPLAPDGLGGVPRRQVVVQWQVAEDPGFRRMVRDGYAVADPAWAHSVHVDVDGLRPERAYYYRFRAEGHLSPVGRTRTAPPGGSLPRAARFAVASCANYEQGWFTAYHRLAEEEPDLVTCTGTTPTTCCWTAPPSRPSW